MLLHLRSMISAQAWDEFDRLRKRLAAEGIQRTGKIPVKSVKGSWEIVEGEIEIYASRYKDVPLIVTELCVMMSAHFAGNARPKNPIQRALRQAHVRKQREAAREMLLAFKARNELKAPVNAKAPQTLIATDENKPLEDTHAPAHLKR